MPIVVLMKYCSSMIGGAGNGADHAAAAAAADTVVTVMAISMIMMTLVVLVLVLVMMVVHEHGGGHALQNVRVLFHPTPSPALVPPCQEFTLPLNMTATCVAADAIRGAQFAVLAVPVQASRSFLKVQRQRPAHSSRYRDSVPKKVLLLLLCGHH